MRFEKNPRKADEIAARYGSRAARWNAPLFDAPLPEMEDAQKREIERDFRAGGGLISTYAMRTKTHPVEATRNLMAAGMLEKDDPIAMASMDNPSYRMAADGTLPGGDPLALKEHPTISLVEFDQKLRDDKSAMPAFAANREAVGVLAGTRKRLAEAEGQEVPTGMLAPSFERAARAIQAEWESGGRKDPNALNDAREMMTTAMLDSSAYVHVEKELDKEAARPVNPIMAAARRLAGKRAPARPRNAEAVEL